MRQSRGDRKDRSLGTADRGEIACGDTKEGDTANGLQVRGRLAKEHFYAFTTTGDVEQEYLFKENGHSFVSIWNSDWSPVHTEKYQRLSKVLPSGVQYYVTVEGEGSGDEISYSLMMTCKPLGTADRGEIACGDTKEGGTADGLQFRGRLAKEHFYAFTTTGAVEQKYSFRESGPVDHCRPIDRHRCLVGDTVRVDVRDIPGKIGEEPFYGHVYLWSARRSTYLLLPTIFGILIQLVPNQLRGV